MNTAEAVPHAPPGPPPVRAVPLDLAPPIHTRASAFGRLRTMAGIGVQMMFHDRLKLLGTLFGVVFAVLLANLQMGVFFALLLKNQMFVEATQADVWVTPPGTEQFQGGGTFLTDAQLNRVRAMPGVAWAEPLVLQAADLKLPNGGSEPVSLVGVRGPRWAGGPWNLVAGSVEALNQPDAIILEDAQREKFGGVNLGSVREVGGKKVQVVGFTWGLLPFAPAYAFAEESLARQILRRPDGKHNYILVGAAPGVSPTALRADVQAALADTTVMTRKEYLDAIYGYIVNETQIGQSVGGSAVLGLLVGLITVALSMFSSVIDNLRAFGTLKAIGSTTWDLALLLLTQALLYGVLGSLIGLGAIGALVQSIRNPLLTPIVSVEQMGLTVVVMVGICLLASVLALLRLRSLEPAMVFR